MELQPRKLERWFFSQKSVQRFDWFPWFGRREPERWLGRCSTNLFPKTGDEIYDIQAVPIWGTTRVAALESDIVINNGPRLW